MSAHQIPLAVVGDLLKHSEVTTLVVHPSFVERLNRAENAEAFTQLLRLDVRWSDAAPRDTILCFDPNGTIVHVAECAPDLFHVTAAPCMRHGDPLVGVTGVARRPHLPCVECWHAVDANPSAHERWEFDGERIVVETFAPALVPYELHDGTTGAAWAWRLARTD